MSDREENPESVEQVGWLLVVGVTGRVKQQVRRGRGKSAVAVGVIPRGCAADGTGRICGERKQTKLCLLHVEGERLGHADPAWELKQTVGPCREEKETVVGSLQPACFGFGLSVQGKLLGWACVGEGRPTREACWIMVQAYFGFALVGLTLGLTLGLWCGPAKMS